MRIEELYLKSFRSHQKLHITLHPCLNIFYGPNAVGKTNILEAIGLLSIGKSFRGSQEKDMVQTGTEAYHIACKYKKNDLEYKLSYGSKIENGKIIRRIKLNEQAIHGRKALIGEIICVFFSPSDILIAEGGPNYRRRFIDSTLSYQNKDYLQNLILFNQAIRQRNAVLRNIRKQKAEEKSLEIWDINLSKYAAVITKNRLEFMSKFKKTFEELTGQISLEKDKTEIELLLSHPEETSNYLKLLQNTYKRDINMGYTFIGPHRHSLLFKEGGESVTERFSQGQKRSLVIALRMAQFYFLRESLQLDPVLLIDDIFGDLDERRKESLFGILEKSGQVIITTPKINDLDLKKEKNSMKNESYVYHIASKGGEVVRVQEATTAI